MVLLAVKQIEQSVCLNDVSNVSVLGVDQGNILLFAATSTSLSRTASTPRTVIGGIQLNDGEQKIYHRHGSSIKVTHASINAARTLCCFVTRTEPYNFEVFVADIGATNHGRLSTIKLRYNGPIRAYLAPHDIVLLLYRDVITTFRVPGPGDISSKSFEVEKDSQVNECVYYQWDTLQQRLHVVQKRLLTSAAAMPSNNYQALVYKAYTMNAKGQLDSNMKIDFDMKFPSSSTSHANFEILSNDTGLFLCWQSVLKEETDKVEYAVVSLGHGRSLYVSKSLQRSNWEIFQSRKVHFGLLNGDYVFAILRREFVHLLNFNVQLNFLNHLCLPNDAIELPYDTKYTTQRGLTTQTSTVLYEKKNLVTYTIEVCLTELVKVMSSTTMESIIAYGLVATKNVEFLTQLFEQILFRLYDDLNTKAYLKEILTALFDDSLLNLALIFNRLSKRIHHNKYILVFPATTVNSRHNNDTTVTIHPVAHHREHGPEYRGSSNIDKDYYEKLRSFFDLSRKYRHKVSYHHPMLTTVEENELHNEIGNEMNPNRRSSLGTSPQPSSPLERRGSSPRFFSFGRNRGITSPRVDPTANTSISNNPKSFILLDAKNKHLFDSVTHELQQLHSSWEKGRIQELAFEYVQATQDQCNYLIKALTRLANFDQTQALVDDDPEPATERYKTLLVVMEKLYLAMVELGFSPTDDLQRILIEVSFRVMPFDRFVAAIDQNLLTLTEEFVSRIILELDNDPRSYAMKEQLILMLPNINSDLHSRLFALMKTDRAKRTTAQLLVARSFSADNRTRGSSTSYESAISHEMQVDELMNVNNNPNGSNTHSRLVEQAAVTFFRDFNERGVLDEDEMGLVKVGLFSLASAAP